MSNSWMPPAGRRNVDVGSSLSRALKARKGDAPPQRARHVRDFYSFRYNFKPSSIDPGERGKISIKKGKEHSTVEVERPGIQPGDAFMFTGQETQAKEWDCVLIYDDVSDTYTLEKLDSYVTLKYDRKASAEHTDSPPAPTPPVQSSKRDTKDDQEAERSADADVDADGDFDAEFEEIIPTSIARREEEEEDEDPVIIIPPTPKEPKPARDMKILSQPPAPPAAPATAPAPKPVLAPAQKSIPTLPVPKPRQSAASTTKSKPVPLPRAKKHKRDPEPVALSTYLSDADEEDLEFGKPAKRARPSPPSTDLALPSVSASVYTPPPPVVRQPSPPPPPAAVLSESEEEWDEVAAVGNVKGTETEDDFDIFGDAAGAEAEGEGGEDIDVNELEREINLQMDEDSDEDFLAAVVEEAPTSLPARGGPISLKELAGGAAYASEDEYSSSDESDDD